jgi:hypothetical protein
MDTHMSLRNLAALFATIITLSFTQLTYAVPGDILQTLTVKNNFNFAEIGGGVDINDVGPTSPHGIAFGSDGFLYVLDFGTDRIYKVYPKQVTDEDGTVHEAGDSPFNFPVDEPNDDGHLLAPGGGPLPACGAYFDPVVGQTAQYCGGGGLAIVNNSLWNASPVTDQILKMDIADGQIQSDNAIETGLFPSPTSLAYDSTFFWILNWQSNSISKVNPTTGAVIASYEAGFSTITGTRPVGIVWDQKDLWLSYEGEGEEIIYRVKPNDATSSLDILDSFSAPGSSDIYSKPKDLAFDGEFLWHADAGTGKIYRLETDINPFGIVGCIEKNGIGVNSGVLLSQAGAADQLENTVDGCFQFPSFLPGIQIGLEVNEAGVSGKPFIKLNGTEEGSTDIILIVTPGNATAYDENNYNTTVTDSEDGDISYRITATPNVIDNDLILNTSVVNETGVVIKYEAIDLDGNHADPVYRTIYILPADVTPPVIFLNGGSAMTIEQNINNANLYIEAGAYATDDRDNNTEITALIAIAGSVNTSVAGVYVITYDVTDEAGNIAIQVARTITVKDTTPPAITILGSNPLQIEKGDSYVEAGAEIQDNVEGSVTLNGSNITGTVDTDTVGAYTVNYSYTDTGGNTVTANRTVNIVDTGVPTITLRGSSTINHELSTPYTDPGARADDDTGEVISSDVPFTGSVNVNSAGTYTLTYNISDASGNAAPTVTRQVIVDDTGSPTLSLLGNPVMNIQKGDAYNEPGASATDVIDDDTTLTASIVITGAVDTNTNGTYTRTYNVNDSAGNAATALTRTITVSDTGIPVISLIGNSTINLQKGDTYNELGATATDAVDDDATLTAAILITGTVDTSINDTYTVTYTVSDSTGNAAAALTRTVIVADTGTPVITLIGNSTINLQKGDTYNELGATATDAVDDDTTLTAAILIAGTVDTSTNGTYTRTYNVSDSTGNAAIQVTRIIIVADTGKPVITLTGNQTINLQKGDTYTELGATATDSVDNDTTLTAAILISGTVDANTIGTYTLTYSVSDSTGNAAIPVTRTVIVSDTGSPVISLIGNQTINLQTGDTYNEQGATATDSVDDDATLSAAIVITGTVNTSINATYTLTYSVSDSAGNAAISVTRAVNVADTGTPVISLIGNQTINLQKGDTYNELGATATDAVDDNATLTANIAQSGVVNTSTIGTYTRTYNVSDSAGNAAITVTRTIIVSDTGIPVITLNDSSIINHEQGTPFTDPGATALDSVDGDMGTFFAPETVNTSLAGTYTLTYNISDGAGNAAIQLSRDVIVDDTIAPVITIIGSASINHEQGDTYTDQGATALDSLDGNVTVAITGTVNTNAGGTYTLSYNATDLAGNNATTITRDVNVADTIIPIITLVGLAEMDHNSGGPAFVDPGITATDNFDGDITNDVPPPSFVVSGDQYLLSYDVNDAAGNAAITKNRTVNVVSASTIDTEAETATIGGTSTIDILGSGWTGSGYVKIQDATFEAGDYLEYSITAYGVPYNLTIRYASLSDINPVEVILNGTSLGLLNLAPSGADDTYINSSDSFIITPLSGVNTLRLHLTDDYGDKRIDSLTLTPQ